MATETQHAVEPEFTEEEMAELRGMHEEDSEDQLEDQQLLTQELNEGYNAPEPEEKQNQHSFLHKAAFGSDDTVRTTFLSESELGRPLFNVRFLLDMQDVAFHYLKEIIKDLKLDPRADNKIATYFHEKTQNITASGMSNKGFSMNLNVTRRMDSTRKRLKDNPLDQKGGKK